MTKNSLNLSKNTTLGSWITLAHPALAEIMSKSDFDWLTIDLEHSTISIREAEDLIRIISLNKKIPLVRLTSNDENQIKRIMDAGANGIIIPMIKTKEEALKAVQFCKYPPQGKRGVGLARAQGYGEKFNQYVKWEKNNSTIIVQIEHYKAVENLQDILSVKGIDGFFVGPYDLSASLNIPGKFTHPKFIKYMLLIKKHLKNKNIIKGFHIVEPDKKQLKTKIKEGYNFISYSLDIRLLKHSISNLKNKIKL